MKVKVKLYGTLSQRFPDYPYNQGMEVEIRDGATVQDLLTLLEIPAPPGAVVIAEGRVQKADDEIRPGVLLNVLQAVSGG
jgi:sulfur carrier protein ThiS